MKIDDLIQLLNNRLREFQLSRDYARMSGDLERMNSADKEIISLEDTLFKLNLLIDTSKSAAVKEEILAEVITDGSVAVLGEYDITPYATDPKHEEKIMNILSKMGVMDTVGKIDDYIKGKYLSSPITGEMVMSAASAYSVDARLMMAIMEQDSGFATAGKAVRTLNPGNVGNNDAGDTVTYGSWQEGVTAVARWLSRHHGSTIIPETPEETVAELIEPEGSSDVRPESSVPREPEQPTATSTPPIITPDTAAPVEDTPAEETIPVTTSTTTTTTTDITPDTTTPVEDTPAEEAIPVTTSTTTTTTTDITPDTAAPVEDTPAEETIPVTTSTPSTGSTDSLQADSGQTSSGQATSTTTTTTSTFAPDTAAATPAAN